MNNTKQLNIEAEKLLKSAYKLLDKEQKSEKPNGAPTVKESSFHEFRMLATSWLMRVFGESHIIYKTFVSEVTHATSARTKRGIGILEAAKKELENNWQENLKNTLLKDMLQELLRGANQHHKVGDSRCAVLQCGAVIEFALQRICLDAGLSVINEKMRDGIPQKKKAMQLASEAYRKKLYERQHHKNLMAWIELYNTASSNESVPPKGNETAEMLRGTELFLRENYFKTT